MPTNLELKSKSAGFTLVELLIAIMILGILVSSVLTVINPAKQRVRAQDGVLKGAISKIGATVDAYYAAKVIIPNTTAFKDEVLTDNDYYTYSDDYYWFTLQNVVTGYANTILYSRGWGGCIAAANNEDAGARSYYVQDVRNKMRKCSFYDTYWGNVYKNQGVWSAYYACGLYDGNWTSWMGSCTEDLN